VTETLSQQRKGSEDVVSSPKREDSPANTGDSDSKSRSGGSNDTSSESGSSKRAKVAMANVATKITFDFGVSNVGKTRVVAMESHTRYFLKGYCWAPDAETVPTPRANEAVMFKDLFVAGLHMPLHPVLVEILQKKLGSTASVDAECYCSNWEVYLGDQLLRRSCNC
jgi:hypothetical protein